ncbi:hypothetical protein GQ42DRAFT_5727 [Ramicandelaber brevisporus]|nr:hypothetical protein GQ42DRAFT_5727 [Ramicandelaber brevisporus]
MILECVDCADCVDCCKCAISASLIRSRVENNDWLRRISPAAGSEFHSPSTPLFHSTSICELRSWLKQHWLCVASGNPAGETISARVRPRPAFASLAPRAKLALAYKHKCLQVRHSLRWLQTQSPFLVQALTSSPYRFIALPLLFALCLLLLLLCFCLCSRQTLEAANILAL